MPKNHKLNYCLIKFLSSHNFLNSEFKTIFDGFTSEYPEFCGYHGYQRTYHIIRSLAKINLITIIRRKNQSYEYSSNYTTSELNAYLLNKGIKFDFQIEFEKKLNILKVTMEKTQLEIQFFDQYIKEFPLLRDTLIVFKKNSEQQLKKLESEISVLNKISAHI